MRLYSGPPFQSRILRSRCSGFAEAADCLRISSRLDKDVAPDGGFAGRNPGESQKTRADQRQELPAPRGLFGKAFHVGKASRWGADG